ncbi:hypothetical protein CEP52_010530 [Fusarium oligoseptatum]|uniref:Uncharacterized protein n=1 Tax=Fusarium oligoseptatum TaxID=2604345 RepID=A0A428T7M8_9HYPO|nr:hypothetical protein CEP52_010530 [Fusarium oligoseptatum]
MLHAFSAAGVCLPQVQDGSGAAALRVQVSVPAEGAGDGSWITGDGSWITGDGDGDAVRTVGTEGTAPKTNKRRSMPARDQDMAWIKG